MGDHRVRVLEYRPPVELTVEHAGAVQSVAREALARYECVCGVIVEHHVAPMSPEQLTRIGYTAT